MPSEFASFTSASVKNVDTIFCLETLKYIMTIPRIRNIKIVYVLLKNKTSFYKFKDLPNNFIIPTSVDSSIRMLYFELEISFLNSFAK